MTTMGSPHPEVVGSAVAQLLPHLDSTMAVGCVQALCAGLDADTLSAVHDTVGRVMFVRSRGPSSPPSTPVVPVDLVTKAALRVGLDLNCKVCSLAALGGNPAVDDHADDCQTIEAIRIRLG